MIRTASTQKRFSNIPTLLQVLGQSRLAHLKQRYAPVLSQARAGGELDQIQFLLGYVSVQTTERYLGYKQRIRNAVNESDRHSA